MIKHSAAARISAPYCRPASGAAILMASLLFSSALLSANAYADGAAAARNLYATMQRAGYAFDTPLRDVVVEPTLVRGMYALMTRQGALVSITNESGTLSGDGNHPQVYPAGGGKARALTAEEVLDLRTEVLANIDYDQLIKVQYGDGGGRKLLLFSALDCGYCKKLEDGLAKNTRTLNTSFYVLPGSLRGQREGGLPVLQAASRIKCAPKNGLAWQSFWSKNVVPTEADGGCRVTPASLEREEQLFKHVLLAAGIKIQGYPTLMNENGDRVPHLFDYTAANTNTLFGSGARPPASLQKSPYWIVSAAEANAQQQIAAAQSPGPAQPQSQQQPGKINTKDLLKKLFK